MDLVWCPGNEWEDFDGEPDSPTLVEAKRALDNPAKLPRKGHFKKGPFVHIAFDGGSNKASEGTAGFVIANESG